MTDDVRFELQNREVIKSMVEGEACRRVLMSVRRHTMKCSPIYSKQFTWSIPEYWQPKIGFSCM